MFDEKINIKSVRVELTNERKMYLLRHLGPLLRLASDPKTTADVIVRQIRRPVAGHTFCIMVRFNCTSRTYYSVAMSPYFTRAVREARDEMRRSLSRSYTPETRTLHHLRDKAHQRYFVELFV